MNQTTDLAGILKTLHARESIRTTLARYTWAGDFLDVDAFVATFTGAGILEIKGTGSWTGREAIRKAVLDGFGMPREDRERIACASRFAHHVSSVQITLVDESHATSDSYFTVMGRNGMDHWGRYRDRFERDGASWLFSHRKVSVDDASDTSIFWPTGI
jgi:hypothetical protein